jgi:GNAT superfamily N-acetyltransferase
MLRRICGSEIRPYLADLARLRIEVFREYPYRYDGTLAYESAYLQHYADCDRSVIVLALVDDQIVGASTGMPLEAEAPEFYAPFTAAGDDPARIFYGGESVLTAAYRGSGVYRQFFLQREAHALELGGYDTFAFCAVERPERDPLRPRDYQPLDATWARYGYTKHPELVAHVAWKDIDEPDARAKPMVFWLKPLPARPR